MKYLQVLTLQLTALQNQLLQLKNSCISGTETHPREGFSIQSFLGCQLTPHHLHPFTKAGDK